MKRRIDYSSLHLKVYSKDNFFNNFANISEERLNEINNIVEQFTKIYIDQKDKPFDIYLKALRYIANDKELNFKRINYDERILILILVVDPDLNIFKEFLNAYSASNRKESFLPQRIITQKFGFFEPYLIKYENSYFRNFLPKPDLVSNVNIDFWDKLLKRSIFVSNFNNLSNEEIDDIFIKVEYFKSNVADPTNPNTIAFNALNAHNVLGFNKVQSMLIFFIANFDADLNILRIYEEESNIKNIKERIEQEIGFYYKDLIRLEKLYHERICPDKKVSIWSL